MTQETKTGRHLEKDNDQLRKDHMEYACLKAGNATANVLRDFGGIDFEK